MANSIARMEEYRLRLGLSRRERSRKFALFSAAPLVRPAAEQYRPASQADRCGAAARIVSQ